MYTIGRIPKWLVERDPTWEKITGIEHDLPVWIKKGSDLHARCSPEGSYCDVTIENRRHGFDLSRLIPNLGVTSTVTSAESDLRKYVSSRYLNPEFDTNKLGLNKIHKFW